MSLGVRVLEQLVRWAGRPLEVHDDERVAREGADLIVVLGAPLAADGGLSAVVAERVDAGVALWKRGVAPVLAMSGGRGPGVRAARSEAEVMAESAERSGVRRSALWIEDWSSNTSTNAKNIAEMCESRGLDVRATRVVVVSQPFHLRRSLLWFQRAGFAARGHWIQDSLQYRDARRAARWVSKEYVSLARDLTLTRRPGP